MSRVFDPLQKFDAREAYAGDFRFAPGVVKAFRRRGSDNAQWVVWIRQMMVSHPGYPAAAEALGVQSTEEIWEVWKDNTDDPDPLPLDKIEIDELPVTPGLIIKRTSLAHYNRWNVSTTRMV